MDIPLYDIDCQSYLEGTHFLRFGLIYDQMERFGNATHWCSFPPRAWIRRPNATMSGRWKHLHAPFPGSNSRKCKPLFAREDCLVYAFDRVP